MNIKHLLLSAAALAASLGLPASAAKPSVLDVKHSITDDAVIFPESFESDTQKLLEGWYMTNYTSYDNSDLRRSDPGASEEVMIKRLSELPTVIEMPYNQVVRQCIERYTKKGRATVEAVLGLSNYYMPIFEQALEAKGLPLELKYLPMIESGLDPNAVSRAGATGLWQLMLATGKGLGLEVNSLVDERRDPYLSSDKATTLLKDLYNTYGDWSLAIAAYNCGPGTVNKAIRRAGGDPKSHDFWSIYNYLPSETRGYVPMFIAANYVMNYYRDHDIAPVLPTRPLVTDTLAISERINLNQISEVLNIPMEELRVLNPQFRADVIPGTASKHYTLVLPSQQIHAYLLSEEKIRNHNLEKYGRRTTADPGQKLSDADMAHLEPENNTTTDDGMTDIIADNTPVQPRKEPKSTKEPKVNATPGSEVLHSVREGESLASIAEQYGVSAEDIKTWNNMSRNSVRIGKKLKIVIPGGNTTAATTTKQTAKTQPAEQASTQQGATTTTPAAAKKTTQATTAQANNGKNNSSKNNAGKNNKNSGKNDKNNQASSKKKKESKPTDYTIKPGDNLSKIAKQHGTTVEALKKANGLKDDHIRDGRTLKIPASTQKNSSKSGSSSKSKKKKR